MRLLLLLFEDDEVAERVRWSGRDRVAETVLPESELENCSSTKLGHNEVDGGERRLGLGDGAENGTEQAIG